MSILEKRHIAPGCLLGTWQITENYQDLMDSVTLEPDEIERLEHFRSHNRKLEYLSVRILLKELIGKNNKIIYDQTNKPFLRGNQHQISISHSHKLTSILVSKTKRVGIDIEYMSHRIRHIRDKFIHPDEVITEDPELLKYHLYIHWCAKEALYKICDKDQLNFKENIFIEPFMIADKGLLKGMVHKNSLQQEFDLMYYKWQNYILVMCCKDF